MRAVIQTQTSNQSKNLGFLNQSKEVITDAAAAARGYLEFGNLDLEAYTEATRLGRAFLKKEYQSKHGLKLTLMEVPRFH